MAISWSIRHKLVYSGTTLVIALLVAGGVWYEFFDHAPSCTDGRQNGTETGIDCGGVCTLVCANQAQDPTVLWARAFSGGNNTYSAAAYIKNNNQAGAHAVHYVFQFFDANSNLVLEKDGVTDIPPIPVVPVVEPAIYVGNRTIARTLFSLADSPQWEKASPLVPLRVGEQSLAADGSRLDAVIENTSLVTDEHNATVAAVLFDSQGVALAASKSLVPTIARQSTQHVVFTWPHGVANAVRAEVTILPSF
jgi:hypothetical protein